MGLPAEVKGVGMASEGGYAVVVEAGGKYLPVMITGDQARSIQLGLSGEDFERPLTHDLLLNTINEMGGALDFIVIDDLMEGTFYAKIHIERYDQDKREKFVLDARPSDAVALAVRTQCPIEVKEEIIEKAGVQQDEIEFKEF